MPHDIYTVYQGEPVNDGIPHFNLITSYAPHSRTKRRKPMPYASSAGPSWAISMILSLDRVKPLQKFTSPSQVRYRNVSRRRPWDHSNMS